MASGLFDIVKHLNEKGDIDLNMQEYSPWIINKALSFHRDTVFFANEMNRFHELSKEAQYVFYKEGIPKGKRFGKWVKADKSELIELLKSHYHINNSVAEQYSSLLSDNQIEELRQLNMKGGKNGARN